MARYQVILAYDGTDFFGFQRQASGPKERTVQAVVETALRQLGWQGKTILAGPGAQIPASTPWAR